MHGNGKAIASIAAVHTVASGALATAEDTIRTLCQEGGVHKEFLREVGIACRRDDIRGICASLLNYKDHLPQGWFNEKGLKPEVLLGFRLIDDKERNIVYGIIRDEQRLRRRLMRAIRRS